jgi:homoserine kinase
MSPTIHLTAAQNTPAAGSVIDPDFSAETLRLRLPATSANLGPGFDTLALALTLGLEIEAKPLPSGATESILTATGRNRDICASTRRNLMLDVYQKTLAAHGAEHLPLALEIRNEIPIGMGFGSSAAVRLAGLALANHFGKLGWDREQVLNEASRLEGHPDNVAACWLGGFTIATTDAGRVRAVSIPAPSSWRALLVMPDQPLATASARMVLPRSYDQDDAVFNIQRASLLTAAFATGRGDLLRVAMQDRMHQPFRGEICPLLPRLLPLAGMPGILGAALSGAGPSVLLLVEEASAMSDIRSLVSERIDSTMPVELIECGIESSPAVVKTVAAK